MNKQSIQPAFERSRHVAMVTSQFLPEVYGGAEQQCLRLSVALAERGARPVIVTSRSDIRTPAVETLSGIPVHRLFTPHPPQLGGRRIASTLRWLRALDRWFGERAGEIDVVHCHQGKINAFAGVRLARAHGLPSVVKIGTASPNFDLRSLEKKRWLYGRMMARYVAAHADRFVAISGDVQRDLVDYGVAPARCARIANGIALAPLDEDARRRARAAQRDRLGIDAGESVLLFVGRMEPQKNVELLLRAVAGLETPPRLLLCGDGAGLSQHRREAETLGLGARARFLGRVEDVSLYLAASDLFVLPAKAEGLSNALLEAMAMAVPCVASRVSGNTELIEDGVSGWLFDLEAGAEALRATLQAALDAGPEGLREMGQAGRRRVERDHDIGRIADRYLELYRSLMVAADEAVP